MLSLTDVRARNLNYLWFELLERLLQNPDKCRVWTVEGKQGSESRGDTGERSHIGSGSYVGTRRWEFDHIRIHVTHPGERPLIPDHRDGIPNPVTGGMEQIQKYYEGYLVGSDKQECETYTYGERIAPQIPAVLEKFHEGGWGTNQCTIAVAQPSDIFLPDPPCLRLIDFRIYPAEGLREGEQPALHMTVYFRSWDLWGGLPANLAGLRLLQEDMAAALSVEAGEIVAISKGLHLYEDSWNAALRRLGESEISPEELVSRVSPRGQSTLSSS